MHTALNVLHLFTDADKYIYVFDDHNRDATLRQIAQHAADPQLSLTWFDAAMLSKKIRETIPTEEGNEGQASQQNHTQVAKLAAAIKAGYIGKGVAKCGQPSRLCGPG